MTHSLYGISLVTAEREQYNNPLSVLPFATVSDDGRIKSLWSRDLSNGASMADACIDFMFEGSPSLLGQVAKAQMGVGTYGQTEVSFWHRIAMLAMIGARVVGLPIANDSDPDQAQADAPLTREVA